MASTFTSSAKLEKQGTGEHSGTWGVTLNTDLDLIEDMAIGVVTKTIVNGSNSLSQNNGASDEARFRTIVLSGALTGAASVELPDGSECFKTVVNNTTGGQVVTFKNVSGDGIVVPTSTAILVYSDGTSIYACGPATYKDGTTNISGSSVAALTIGTLGVTHIDAASVSTSTGVINSLQVPTLASIGSLNVTSMSSPSGGKIQTVGGVVSCSALTATDVNALTKVVSPLAVIQQASVSTLGVNVVTVTTIQSNGGHTALLPFAYGRLNSSGTLVSGFNIGGVTAVATGQRRVSFTTQANANTYTVLALGTDGSTAQAIVPNIVSCSTVNFLVETRNNANTLTDFGVSFIVYGG